ncbi:MAG: hypothetical protein ACR2PA_17675 [Hyphomicrobiaceae bacterium]
MQLIDQTPDEICRALGLPSFETKWNRTAPDQELRLLLLPTFHPELCLTFSERDATTSVTVTYAQSKMSPFEQPSPSPVDQDTGRLRNTRLADLETSLRKALVEPDHLSLSRDGIIVYIFWRTFNARLIVDYANPEADSALGVFVGRVIAEAYQSIKSSACKGSLAEAGLYLGRNLASPQTDA